MSFSRSPLRNARLLQQEGFYRPEPSSIGYVIAAAACVIGIVLIILGAAR